MKTSNATEMTLAKKSVFRFGGGAADGRASDRNLLGGKGANLAEMASIGLPVPPGFTIATTMCARYHEDGGSVPTILKAEVADGLTHIETITNKCFGDPTNPLLVSVRSGARVSMPGMMDTVLNLGLNDVTVEGLASKASDARFAWDSYRRFIQMYSDVVLDLDHGAFEEALETLKKENGFQSDTELTTPHLRALVATYKVLVKTHWGKAFPQDVHEQLWGAIGAVFGSWQSERAKVYRRLHGIPSDWGTAVNIQAMVFGNMGETSATGVAFTRDPAKGTRRFFGEFLVNAQGEDVVAGIRTPQYLTRAAREEAHAKCPSMEEVMPDVYAQLADVFRTLETHYRDMQDIEFTVEQTRLWILQTRAGKRTAKAALKIAVEMAQESLISRDEAILRVDAAALEQLLHPMLDPDAHRDIIAKGLPASPGAASGHAAFDAETAERWAAEGKPVILVRAETSPEDIHGMHAAKGILTARGGMTSHAAVVARGMGRPCVSGSSALIISSRDKVMRVGAREIKEGDILTLDGSAGDVMIGAVATVQPDLSEDFLMLMSWADVARRMTVRTNADTPADAQAARKYGAEGIGLCRTEHMFFEADRITAVRQMILAEDEAGRRAALEKLRPAQREDFEGIFKAMSGLPVTIRLLDPPLHEFLPQTDREFAEVSEAAGISIARLKHRASELHEFNPMLGHRGVRLGVSYPEIYEMQARAIFEAAVSLDQPPVPEIMIPLVATKRELDLMKAVIDRTAKQVFAELGRSISYLVGTMIELPRAALRAGDIAASAQFFSFGTNDLTQTALGLSRDDSSRFLKSYVEQGIYAFDPFVSLDIEGVGELISLATARGRETRADLKLGLCGEHGGDPSSISFCEQIGLDYVSTSPYRVPVARLAAAQAALRLKSS